MITKIENKEKSFLLFIIFLNLIIKILFFFYYRDVNLANEWLVMFQNLENFGILSYHSVHTNQLPPNSYMPPLYVYLIFIISKINLFDFSLVNKVISFQIILNTISIIFIFYTFKNFFKRNVLLFSIIIYAFYPLAIYSSVQISSTTITMFLLSSFCFFHFSKKNNYYKYIFYGTISGLLILIRGEFYLLYFVILVFELVKNKQNFTKLLLSLIVSILIISPYLIRNYNIFEKVIITQSVGYNLWRGNNQLSSIDSIVAHNFIYNSTVDNSKLKNLSDKETIKILNFREKVNSIDDKNIKYDLVRDNIFFEEFKTNIRSDPIKYLFLSFKKLFSFVFINFESHYKNYYNIGVIIPEILISIFSFYGFIYCLLNYKKNYFFINIFIYYSAIFSIFFVLPRYKLIVLPILCYFTVIGLMSFLNRFKLKK